MSTSTSRSPTPTPTNENHSSESTHPSNSESPSSTSTTENDPTASTDQVKLNPVATIQILTILVNSDTDVAAELFLDLYRSKPQVALDVYHILANAGQAEKEISARLVRGLYQVNPVEAKLFSLDIFRGREYDSVVLGAVNVSRVDVGIES